MLFMPTESNKLAFSEPPAQTSTVKVVHSSARDQPAAGAPPTGQPTPTVEDIGTDFLKRRNGDTTALGRFRRRKVGCFTEVLSFDNNAWYFQAVFTAFVILGNMCVAWGELGWCEFLICCTLCLVAFVSSALVTCTDPGIYPRFQEGEADPLADKTTLVYCRKCRLRRPPRASHCYACDVCVLEHDHHCGIVGGCVGQRSLRWFTLFLVCASTACCMGLYWMIRHLFLGLFAPDKVFGSAATLNTTTTTRLPLKKRPRGAGEPSIDVTLTHLGAVFMILFDMIVILLVGAMACMYTYLTLTSTTRRESRRSQTSWRVLFKPTVMVANVMRTAFPPASLVIVDKKHEDAVAIEELV